MTGITIGAMSLQAAVDSVSEGIEELTQDVSGLKAWASGISTGALNFLLRVLLALIIYYIASKLIGRLVRFVGSYMDKKNVDPSARAFIIAVVRYGLLTLVVVEVILFLDLVEASSIAALFAAGGVGISLAMQGVLSNFAGGILLLILKPFRVGDFISVPAVSAEGIVKKIEIYYTTLETIFGETISIPNSSLTNNQVTNYTLLGRRKLNFKIGISYRSDPEKALQILRDLVSEEPRLEKEGQEFFVDSLGESAVILCMRAFCTADDYWPVMWEFNRKVKAAFDAADIQIPYNQVDVHMIHVGEGTHPGD